jgi:hypothetical protein
MVDQRTRIVAAVLNALKLPPRFRLKLVKDDPIRLELSLTPAYGKSPILVGIVESQDLVARRDREGRIPRDLQGTWDWTVRHGTVTTGGMLMASMARDSSCSRRAGKGWPLRPRPRSRRRTRRRCQMPMRTSLKRIRRSPSAPVLLNDNAPCRGGS